MAAKGGRGITRPYIGLVRPPGRLKYFIVCQSSTYLATCSIHFNSMDEVKKQFLYEYGTEYRPDHTDEGQRARPAGGGETFGLFESPSIPIRNRRSIN